MRVRPLAFAAVPLLLAAMACAPEDDEPATTTPDPTGSTTADPCATESLPTLESGVLTVATDNPAFEPFIVDNDPTNGKGFEGAVAYAVADKLGFGRADVKWVRVHFNNSFKPGPKDFDFDINQVSISAERARAVDFSDGYYSASQAVIALKGSPAASATTLADLKGLKLGAQTGTTSLTAIRDGIQPDSDPLVFQSTSAAKQAMQNEQIDAFLADLPTAFYITSVEIPAATIVGQFQPTAGKQEEFGLLFEKGNPLVTCVNEALAELKTDGALADFEEQWLSNSANVPVLE